MTNNKKSQTLKYKGIAYQHNNSLDKIKITMSGTKKGMDDLAVMSSRFKEKELRSKTSSKKKSGEKKTEEDASQKKSELEEADLN